MRGILFHCNIIFFQVLLQDGVLHSLKREADVLRFYGSGEVDCCDSISSG